MGTLASGLNSQTYEKVYAQQATEEKKLKRVLGSVFITPADQEALSKQLALVKQVEKDWHKTHIKNRN